MSAELQSVADPEITAEQRRTAPEIAMALIDFQLRNFESFTKAQQTIMEGNRSLVGQQLESFISSMTQATKVAQDIIPEPDLKANLRKRFASAKSSMQDATGSLNVLMETSARSNAEALGILQERAYEAFDEIEVWLETLLSGWPATVWRRN